MSKKILAIETSCDETALALVECNSSQVSSFKFQVLRDAVASQIKVHRPYGGVVPHLAKREHVKNLPILSKKIFRPTPASGEPRLRRENDDIDKIVVTVGPGLEPALWVGINFANDLGKKLKVPVVGINHLEGHIYSNWIEKNDIQFPAIVLPVSGGHTIILKMTSMKRWRKLGETRDDAVGEAFDKVAKMLKLPYPGGPEIEKLAKKGKGDIPFPRPMLHSKNYDFSFSGLKTAVLYHLRDNKKVKKVDVAASFQQAAIDVLVAKTMRAAQEFKAKSILVCGGVACNKSLKKRFDFEIKNSKLKIGLHIPPIKYNTDNAVMIGAAACWGNHYSAKKALPNLNL